MTTFQPISAEQVQQLEQRGCSAEAWQNIFVTADFRANQLTFARLGGRVEIGSETAIYNSTVRNYSLGDGVVIDNVQLMECSGSSSYGTGVSVATINENGGRSVRLYDGLTAQVAYMWAMNRDRSALMHAFDKMVDGCVAAKQSAIGSVGARTKIVAARIIRDVCFGEGVEVDGASLLSNGTLLSDARVGIDVKARDFIAVEDSFLGSGATIERCFVGERAIVSNGFTAIDSLFFASSHCENGEAASIFAGPYTVSHHKSTLLIAGGFSFFNAGSGTNQSNHLFKSGPVHQSMHLRGVKFGSDSYVMSPAVEGAFTVVLGRHSQHHDTQDFPFSMLLCDGDRSSLIPAGNIATYGTKRDIEKWQLRDKRVIKRDNISFEASNPYIAQALTRAVNTIHGLQEKNPDSDQYIHNRVIIRAAHLKRGLTQYNKAIAAQLGAMLSKGGDAALDGCGYWLDLGGQYISKNYVDAIIDSVENDEIASFAQIDDMLNAFASNYDSYAYSWALALYTELLGAEPTAEQIESAINGAQSAQQQLDSAAERDKLRDYADQMQVSYGMDSYDEQRAKADFAAVQSL